MPIKTFSFKDLCNPTDKQKEGLELMNNHKFLLYGGAMGGGKSYFLRWALIYYLIKQFKATGQKGIRVGLFCEDYPALKDRHLSKIRYEFPRWMGTIHKQDNEFRLIDSLGGGVMALRNLDDPSKYASSEFAAEAVDELTKNEKSTFDFLRTRLRWPGISDVKFIAATNPGGIGHNWVKALWLDRIFEPTEQEADQFVFLPSTVYDNPYLDKGYIKSLSGLPENMRKAFLEGDWNLFEGQYFTEWRTEKHVVRPFVIPPTWRKFGALDFGRTAPFCFHWYAIDYDGNVFCYKEYYEKGLDAEENARNIMRMNGTNRLEYVVGDSSIFSKIGLSETIAEVLMRSGIGGSELMPTLVPSSKQRIDGWILMHEYLSWNEEREPKLKYFSTCKDAIRTIPSLIHDERKPEDLDTKMEDHCFVGNTLVDTPKGQIKIKDLVGKEVYVNTQQGFKKCRSVRKTRKTEVWEVTLSNGVKIKATPDHQFLTNKGWKELKDIDSRYHVLIQYGICTTSYLKLFRSLTEKGITSVVNTFRGRVNAFISQFGNITMERFQKDFIYTTETRTEATTTSRILNSKVPMNIYRSMLLPKNTKKEVGETLKSTPDQKRLNGTNQKKGGNGIVRTQGVLLRTGSGLKRAVLSVKRNIRLLSSLLLSQSTAIRIVRLQPCGEEEVYDLTVPGVEQFTIERGVVVHNCADTDRYFLQTLRQRKSTYKSNVELKLEKLRSRDDVSGDFNKRFSI